MSKYGSALALAVGLAAAVVVPAGPADAAGSRRLAAAKAITPSGSPFSRALHGEYTMLGDDAYKEYDGIHGRRYIRKALEAAHGAEPAPENPHSWLLPGGGRAGPLYEQYDRLVAALDSGGRKANPRAAARAQAMYDCWLEEEHEDFWLRQPGVEMYQPEDIARCRDGYFAAIRVLAGEPPRAKAPPQAKGPAPAAPPPAAPPPPKEFVIFFAFDRANLNPKAVAEIEKVAAAAKANLPARISVFGHTDRAGSIEYNVGLSKRRAKAVVDALVAWGIAANRMLSSSFGESRPRVPTADGVRHPLNRRAEITVQ